MGQKSNPISNRLGIIYGWKSIWIKNYYLNVNEDNRIRNYINNRYKYCISTIIIEKMNYRVVITICTSKPAIVIGKKGKEVDKLKKNINNIINKKEKEYLYYKKIEKKSNRFIYINVVDVKNPEIDSILVSKNICKQLESRISYKKSIKYAIKSAMEKKINGIKIKISGRLNGAEIARTEVYKEGSIKASTLRSNIDYSLSEANTKYGKIGVKVWIMKGEIYEIKKYFTNYYKNFQYKSNKKNNNKKSDNKSKSEQGNNVMYMDKKNNTILDRIR
ncbi:30S ribosomal protein S3 [Candidatus Shikimatogenerans bostrichidophilus]|uniref:30S ribosomal protein S3 n=1 Tax=Candidatus Shikimatogenerans bostrichidophilus TaxID=2943807 RepID=UPI002966FFE0